MMMPAFSMSASRPNFVRSRLRRSTEDSFAARELLYIHRSYPSNICTEFLHFTALTGQAELAVYSLRVLSSKMILPWPASVLWLLAGSLSAHAAIQAQPDDFRSVPVSFG